MEPAPHGLCSLARYVVTDGSKAMFGHRVKQSGFALLLTLLILSAGCMRIPPTHVTQFLEQMGYRVLSYEGQAEQYQLTKARLTSLPYMIYWGLQTVDPASLLGKTVTVEQYLVTNHPLDQWTPDNSGPGAGKSTVYVFVIDHQPIGGTSYPATDDALGGGYWSLDGRTLEEVHQIKDFPAWKEAWMKRFQ